MSIYSNSRSSRSIKLLKKRRQEKAGAIRNLANKNYTHENFAMESKKANTYRRPQHGQNKSQGQASKLTRQQNDAGIFCYCCGNTRHPTKECRHRGLTCNFCKVKGHLERACIKKKKATNQFLHDESGENEQQHDEDDSRSDSPERNNYLDFHSIGAVDKVNSSNCARNNLVANPMFIDAIISGKTVKMEIDSGTYFTVMSETFVNKYLSELEISKAITTLVGYENNAMEPRGQLKNLHIK